MAEKNKISPRQIARRCAVQALYQNDMTGEVITNVRAQFMADEERMKGANTELFSSLLRGAFEKSDESDALIATVADRAVEKLDPVERAILRLAIYELKYSIEVPYRVILNEAIELAKVFGAEQSHKFVNATLDKLTDELRSAEKSAEK